MAESQVVVKDNPFRRWIEKVAEDAGSRAVKSRAADIAYTIRQVGEGAVVGSILGAIDAEVGLDQRGVPLDLVGTAFGSAAAIYFAGEDFSHDIRNAASDCMTVFSYRKTKELVQRLGGGGGAKVSGEDGDSDVGEEDPVVQAAREL